MEQVIIVDENDLEIGSMEKMEAHRLGVLHRAISVIIFNSKGELLLQRRAAHKYHSPGLWTNTCCSHPRPNEDSKEAANRRLMEEMGIATALHKIHSFTYFAEFENGLSENEYDHLFVGFTDDLPKLNPEETDEYKYVSFEELNREIELQPENFTVWFKIIMNEVSTILKEYVSEHKTL